MRRHPKGKNLILTGFMGTGKTSVGRALAERLGIPFVDTDDLIERNASIPVSDIFQRWGESRFRAYESRAVEEVTRLHRCVISVGGGALLRDRNRRLLKRAGITVLLTASPEVIKARTSGKSGRPLLPPDCSIRYIEEMLERRRESYSDLDLVVDTSALSPVEVVDRILDEIRASYPELSVPISFGDIRRCVRVDLGSRSYDVLVAPTLLGRVGDEIIRCTSHEIAVKAMVITNPLVGSLYGGRVSTSLREIGFDARVTYVPDGERFKTLQTVRLLYDRLLEEGFDRSSLVIPLGGGVIGDTGGFAAATYMRGIKAAYVPTTLLAQVDAAVGGKVGVNHPKGKNLIGCFSQPMAVLVDPLVLLSLPQREFAQGMAEVVKYGLLDRKLFEFLERNLDEIMGREVDCLTHLIGECVKIKANVVERDETESGLRMVLNLGHTFGHAIENVHGYRGVTHGEAVAIGIHCACRLSHSLGGMPGSELERVVGLLEKVGLPTGIEIPGGVDELLGRMVYDKKARMGAIAFVIPRRIGNVEIVRQVPREKLVESMKACVW